MHAAAGCHLARFQCCLRPRVSFFALVCRTGFQKLDKLKDEKRQSKQLEELTAKMRECKRYSCGLLSIWTGGHTLPYGSI